MTYSDSSTIQKPTTSIFNITVSISKNNKLSYQFNHKLLHQINNIGMRIIYNSKTIEYSLELNQNSRNAKRTKHEPKL